MKMQLAHTAVGKVKRVGNMNRPRDTEFKLEGKGFEDILDSNGYSKDRLQTVRIITIP